jgi:hypothetical protein
MTIKYDPNAANRNANLTNQQFIEQLLRKETTEKIARDSAIESIKASSLHKKPWDETTTANGTDFQSLASKVVEHFEGKGLRPICEEEVSEVLERANDPETFEVVDSLLEFFWTNREEDLINTVLDCHYNKGGVQPDLLAEVLSGVNDMIFSKPGKNIVHEALVFYRMLIESFQAAPDKKAEPVEEQASA